MLSFTPAIIALKVANKKLTELLQTERLTELLLTVWAHG